MPHPAPICTLLLLSLVPFLTSNAGAQQMSCTYTSFEAIDGGLGSGAAAINSNDGAVGTYSDNSGNIQSFVRSPNGGIRIFSYSNSVDTFAQGINDFNTIVGYYQDVTNNTSARGFKIQAGKLSGINYPNATYTEPEGINDQGEIVGWYSVGSSPGNAFLLTPTGFRTITYPGAFATNAQAINNSGEVVGWWEDSSITQYGMIYQNGQFQSISYPGSTGTVFTGVNDLGDIAGYYLGPGAAQIPQGFVYSNGTFRLVSVPGAATTIVVGINSQGDIAGTYQEQQFGTATAFIGTDCH